MNPQDKVERVLKEMHVMFSKGLEVGGAPDKMVVDRAEFMNLLDRLTTGIYEMMDEYEQTRSSRMAAERNFRRSADEIIEQANASAEDVYAASILYTADAIGKIRALMDQTNDSMNELFIQFRRELRDQKDQLRANESELQAQLADLSDTRKYLSVLRDINREQERKNRDLEAEREIGNQYARNLFHATVSSTEAGTGVSQPAGNAVRPGQPAGNAERPIRPAAPVTGADRAAGSASGSAPVSGEQPEVTVNRDASYFKWKAWRDSLEAEERAGAADRDEAAGSARSSGTIQNRPAGPMRVTPVKQEPEVRYPTEDVIYQQVQDEERKKAEAERDTGQIGAGEVIKNIIFGRDQE